VTDLPDALAAALAALDAAPLSRRKAMLAALLLDAEIDRRGAGGDLLAARAALAAAHPALAHIMALAALREGGPRLVLAQIEVPPTAYPALGEADYMVSLYNGATVPRVMVALPDGERLDALDLLRAAAAALPHV
jgi:hypothetical protein